MSRVLSPTKILADATPLDQAVFGFGDARDQSAHGRAVAALLLAQSRLRSEGYSLELSALVEETRTARETIEHRMEDRLRQRLTRQELVAVGQRVEAGANSEFEVIPARFWEHAAIASARCEAKAGGDRFAPVYVALMQERHHETAAELHSRIPIMGAPSKADVREKAIRTAAARNAQFFDLPRKEAFRLVEHALDELRPGWRNERGFSIKSIEAHMLKIGPVTH